MKKKDDGMATLMAYVILAIFCMPLVGIYLIRKKEWDLQWLGYILVVIGVFLWIYFGVN